MDERCPQPTVGTCVPWQAVGIRLQVVGQVVNRHRVTGFNDVLNAGHIGDTRPDRWVHFDVQTAYAHQLHGFGVNAPPDRHRIVVHNLLHCVQRQLNNLFALERTGNHAGGAGERGKLRGTRFQVSFQGRTLGHVFDEQYRSVDDLTRDERIHEEVTDDGVVVLLGAMIDHPERFARFQHRAEWLCQHVSKLRSVVEYIPADAHLVDVPSIFVLQEAVG